MLAGGGVKFTHDASCRLQKIGWRKKLDASRMYPRILRRSRMLKCARALHMSQMQLSSMHSLAAKSACSRGFSPKASAAALQEHENSSLHAPCRPWEGKMEGRWIALAWAVMRAWTLSTPDLRSDGKSGSLTQLHMNLDAHRLLYTCAPCKRTWRQSVQSALPSRRRGAESIVIQASRG